MTVVLMVFFNVNLEDSTTLRKLIMRSYSRPLSCFVSLAVDSQGHAHATLCWTAIRTVLLTVYPGPLRSKLISRYLVPMVSSLPSSEGENHPEATWSPESWRSKSWSLASSLNTEWGPANWRHGFSLLFLLTPVFILISSLFRVFYNVPTIPWPP